MGEVNPPTNQLVGVSRGAEPGARGEGRGGQGRREARVANRALQRPEWHEAGDGGRKKERGGLTAPVGEWQCAWVGGDGRRRRGLVEVSCG